MKRKKTKQFRIRSTAAIMYGPKMEFEETMFMFNQENIQNK